MLQGGSIRSASSSKEVNQFVALPVILKAGEWSRTSIFARFYPRTSKPFHEIVLGSGDISTEE